jgi:hypothetical protein
MKFSATGMKISAAGVLSACLRRAVTAYFEQPRAMRVSALSRPPPVFLSSKTANADNGFLPLPNRRGTA